jgi:hypothetical protein
MQLNCSCIVFPVHYSLISLQERNYHVLKV